MVDPLKVDRLWEVQFSSLLNDGPMTSGVTVLRSFQNAGVSASDRGGITSNLWTFDFEMVSLNKLLLN